VDAPQKQPEANRSPADDAVPRLIIRQGASLPHWRMDGATYAVTFRLADSLPAEVLRRWGAEREHTVQQAEAMGRPLTASEIRRLQELHSQRVDEWLDRGHGSCALRDPRIAQLVSNAMRHFDGQRYDLLAWCVMPNHVHAVLRVYADQDLSNILLSWKGFTGKKARELLGSSGEGAFWQKESYDHIVRDDEDLARQMNYVLNNPPAAGLMDWPWVWHRPADH
jgi:REP element-mobilizing transposase RayT